MSNRFKPKFNIKKGDSVVVITGDDKDLKKPRKVLEVYPDQARVLVEGVNIVTKHTKPSAKNTNDVIVSAWCTQWQNARFTRETRGLVRVLCTRPGRSEFF